jgi:hypothetical protein
MPVTGDNTPSAPSTKSSEERLDRLEWMVCTLVRRSEGRYNPRDGQLLYDAVKDIAKDWTFRDDNASN